MYPNPQDALPLPPHPNLEQYRKLAKDLARACRSSDGDAIGDWAAAWVDNIARMQGPAITPATRSWMTRRGDAVEDFVRRKMSRPRGRTRFSLADAQFVLARAHGFPSWPAFAKHIGDVVAAGTPVSRFELAADAVVAGDVAALERLLLEDPELIRGRSTRAHRATLLHYTSANGVESYRQKTPSNAVEVAKVLIEAGAEVNAEADVYGGGATTLGLVATSIHPYRSGLQNALMQVLLDHGAGIDKPGIAGNQQSAVAGALSNGRPEAAEYLATRGARLNLATAAGVGRLDVVRTFFAGDGSQIADSTPAQRIRGFFWACGYGRTGVVQFLLDKGADLAAQDDAGQTGLHWAAMGGHLATVKLLLERNAPLEVENVYGGTVLGQALWSAAHGGDPGTYVSLIEALIAAGAAVPDRHPPINKAVDDMLQQHGSRSDDGLWWFGEKPRERGPKPPPDLS